MDEIRDAGKAMRKAYSYKLTESQRPRNKEVRHFQKSVRTKKSAKTVRGSPCVTLFLRLRCCGGAPRLEFLHASGGVQRLLKSRKERVAS